MLPVGVLVAQLLRAKGAEPIMTRTSLAAVGLTERGVMARRANANAFVSIHLNAFGDGTNPFLNNGTSTLFFHHNSEPLARPMQRELMLRLGLRDLGVHYQNLAVARPTWYPSVLTEGAFVIIPEQEAALRNPAYQMRYAEGIVAGLEAYFRELAQPVRLRPHSGTVGGGAESLHAAQCARSGRPAWEIRTLRTAHFRVHYPVALDSIARRAAYLAENAWTGLAKELATPAVPIDLLVQDNVDLSNGFAQTVPSNRITIYATPPVALAELRFHDDWMRLVITHELGAHFSYRSRARVVAGRAYDFRSQ